MTGKKCPSLLFVGVTIVTSAILSFLTWGRVIAQDTNVLSLPYLDSSEIVYLVDPAELETDASTATRIAALLSPDIVSRWDAVEELFLANSIDALIIDASAFNEVNAVAVSEAYWNGVVVAGINIPANDFAELIGNPCVARDGFEEPYSGDFFILAAHLTLGDDARDVARVEESYRRNCDSVSTSNIRGHVISASPRASNTLESERDFTIFASVLNDHLSDISEIRLDFASGRLRQPNSR
jgi:hypothetical protein